MRSTLITSSALLAAVLIVSWGCQKAPEHTGPKVYPARGQVSYRGKPESGIHVILHPLPLQQREPFLPSGITDEAGNFQVSTFSSGDGAPAGNYAVTFTWPKQSPGADDSEAAEDRLSGRMTNAQASTWKVDVKEGENQFPVFELK